MKTIRSDRYRRKRRRSTSSKVIMLIVIIGGSAIIIAAALLTAYFLFFNHPIEETNSSETTSSDINTEADSEDDNINEIAKINPNAATAKKTGKLAYQSLYPDMYVPIVEKIAAKDGAKVVYLTFDGSPSNQTADLLKVLKKNGVKATFFISCHDAENEQLISMIKKINNDGHSIGIYSYTDDRTKLYSSIEEYLKDFSKVNDIIYQATGIYPTIFRFPGGSINQENQKNYEDLVSEMNRRGYTYFDWNVDSGDSLSNTTATDIYENTVSGILSHGKSVVLLNNSDGKSDTVGQLSNIISKVKKEGYKFDKLDPSVKPFSFAEPEE